jgi:hypothetical protein
MERSVIKYLTESFDWKNTTLYIHKLDSHNTYLDEQLEELKKLTIIDDLKNVYMYSFVHPDAEFCTSFVGGSLINKKFERPVWIAYADPTKLVINKRMVSTGFSLEKISSSFTTNMFLSNGSPVKFKLISKVESKVISTTVPLVLVAIAAMYTNFRIDITDPKNPYPVSHIGIKSFKLWSLPQIFTKSNYIYTYNMIAS